MQETIIILLFALASVYIAKLLYKSFSSTKGCASNCGKCKVDFSAAPETKKGQ